MNRVYKMSRSEMKKFLKIASEQVSFGIYAVEKDDTVEMRNDPCSSISKLKSLKREWKSQGFKVHYNCPKNG